MTRTVLIVEDEPEDGHASRRQSAATRVSMSTPCTPARRASSTCETEHVDVVVTDVQMPGMSGIELCQELRERHPDLLPIVITGAGGLDTAIAAIRAGAYDFITKPVKVDALAIAVGRAIEHLALQRELKRLRSAADRDDADRRHRRRRAPRSARRSRWSGASPTATRPC